VGFLPGYAGPAQRTAIVRHSTVRGPSWGWFLGAAGAVLYGSLIPFNFAPSLLHPSNFFGLSQLAVRGTTLEDLVTNLLIYVPVGLAFVVCGRSARSGRLARVPVAVGVGVLLSLIAETLQVGIAIRYASWTDVFLNGLGTTVGAIAGAIFYDVYNISYEGVRKAWIRDPFTIAALLLTVGLFLYELAPFDLITSTTALHSSFLRAQWSPVNPHLTTFDAASLTPLVAELTGAFWFTMLGYANALSARSRGYTPRRSLASSIKNSVLLVVLIEFMQLFTVSHTFDVATLVIRTNGVILGAWSAIFIVDSATHSAWKRNPGIALPTMSLITLALLQMLAIMLCSADGSALSNAVIDPSRIHWIPFEALWRGPGKVAAGVILSTAVTYGALAGTLAILLRRGGVVAAGWAACTVAVALAVCIEATQALGTAHTADVTIPILALIAAVTITKIHATLCSVHVATPEAADTNREVGWPASLDVGE